MVSTRNCSTELAAEHNGPHARNFGQFCCVAPDKIELVSGLVGVFLNGGPVSGPFVGLSALRTLPDDMKGDIEGIKGENQGHEGFLCRDWRFSATYPAGARGHSRMRP